MRPAHINEDIRKILCQNRQLLLERITDMKEIKTNIRIFDKQVCHESRIAPGDMISKAFLEAGKKRLKGDTEREANTSEVSELRQENEHLKQLVAEITLHNRMLKKSLNGLG